MKQNVIIRKRKSAKHGATYEYRFETACLATEKPSTAFERFPLGYPSFLPLMSGLYCGLRPGQLILVLRFSR